MLVLNVVQVYNIVILPATTMHLHIIAFLTFLVNT